MNFFDDYFVFSSSEKKGIFLFVCILFVMSLFYIAIPYVFTAEKYDFSDFKKELENKKRVSEQNKNEITLFSFNPNTISKDSMLLLGMSLKQSYNVINYRTKVRKFNSEEDFRKVYSIGDSLTKILSPFLVFDEDNYTKKRVEFKREKSDSLFHFDPNTVSLFQLQSLGLSYRQAKTIENFKTKGGRFYKKEDFKKMYSISDEVYKKLEPFIFIAKKDEAAKSRVEKLSVIKIDLNSATKEQLVAIRGIGDKTAERMLKLRKKYGGYVSIDQLDEVYGLDTAIRNNKLNYFTISDENWTKINVNTVTFKELLAHPYCDYNSTKKLINYREVHGKFHSLEQIMENNLIKAEQYRKITPYLTL